MTFHARRGVPATLAVLVALVVAGCTAREATEPSTEASEGQEETVAVLTDRVELSPAALESLRLTYVEVEEQELSPSIEVPADVVAVPDRRATVGPRVSGRVAEVRVNVGDRVERGTVLAVLESEVVGRAWADLIAARARADVARRTLERQRRLLADRVTSERAVEEAEGALLVAEADLQADQTRLATFGVVVSDEPPPDPTRVTLTSPLAGTVVARSANVGQWAEPTETIVEIIDLSALWLEAAVYENEMRLVSVGQTVRVEVRAFPDEVFSGTVSQVAGTLDPQTRTVSVRVALPNPGLRLRPGMFATARIQGTHDHEPRRLLAIPWPAVQQIDDHRAVFVRLAAGVFELRRVHTGERAGDLVEILNGLSAGDEVVTEGSFLLKGQLLRSTLGEDEGDN
jgi:cobalt-zinc-cadmium efflux system membrane fusion protein